MQQRTSFGQDEDEDEDWKDQAQETDEGEDVGVVGGQVSLYFTQHAGKIALFFF